jgi:hypothetical protein
VSRQPTADCGCGREFFGAAFRAKREAKRGRWRSPRAQRQRDDEAALSDLSIAASAGRGPSGKDRLRCSQANAQSDLSKSGNFYVRRL